MNSLKNLFPLLLAGCMATTPSEKNTFPESGEWRFVLDLGERELPFNASFQHDKEDLILSIKNADEVIEVRDITFKSDSLFISLPVFDSEFKGLVKSSKEISGNWYNYAKGPDYAIPFTATHGKTYRFEQPKSSVSANFSGEWEVTFSPESDDSCKAIGSFEQDGDQVSGTFITETGDLRYLEGNVSDNRMMLSTFDGSHAFLVSGDLNDRSEIKGMFWSGTHWEESWSARKNPDFKLSHPDSLTYLVDGYDHISFSFPSLEGKTISMDDDQFNDKVVILQIMGSWCPNCADETRLYSELYDKYHENGLEIVGLAYERSGDFDIARSKVEKMKDHLHANYDFVIAGTARKSDASKTLPMLNSIMSYPTSIFIDRKGDVRRIHTGFYGPGTGERYNEYALEIDHYLKGLLSEKKETIATNN